MRRLELEAVLVAIVVGAIAGCSGLVQVDPGKFTSPAPDAITFWGHACVFIDAGGIGIVTDPVFEKNLWQRRRFIGAPPDDVLARTRVILLSHAHDDHTSPASLARFPKDVVVLCPAPAAEYLQVKGIDARALRPGEDVVMGDVRIIAVAAHHPGGRHGIHSAVDGRALGWVIKTPSATLFYSGDTDYSSTFSDVGWTYAPDIAILNVNGHLLPENAARAARALRAQVVIPTHWGAYGYWLVGGNRHPRGEDELRRLLGDRLHVLQVGESMPLAKARTRP